MSIEIVTHCWSEKLPQYAVMLRAQLSSILLHKPNVPYRIVVCASRNDIATMNAIRYFSDKINLHLIRQRLPYLWRRSIGRNRVALETKFDLVWFADCDYLFNAGCIDAVVSEWQKKNKPNLVWPESILANNDKTEVDRFVTDSVNANGVISPSLTSLSKQWCSKAIGGIQITSGDYCHEHGYLNDRPKWHTPALIPFRTVEDVGFRRTAMATGSFAKIEVPNLVRMRHTEAGGYPSAENDLAVDVGQKEANFE